MRPVKAWAVKWRSKSIAHGIREHLLGTVGHPCRTLLFETRREAGDYIAATYGYIKNRTDLRSEPHGWRMPVPVLVRVAIREVPSKEKKK